MANADVSLLFGVLGEGSLSGESGSLIQSQLTQIMTALNKNPLKIKVALDTEAGGQRSWSSQLQAKLNSISTSGKFSIQISNLKLGTGAIADFKKQLNAVINTLNLDKGTTITLSSDGIGSVTSKLKEASTVADDATQRMAEFNVQMANLRAQSQNIKTGLGGLGTGDIEEERAQIASLTEQYRLWQIEVEKVRLQGATGNDERIASLEREGQAIRSNIDAIKAERAASQETIKTERDITTARRSAATLLTQMQNAEKSWGAARNGNSKESYKNIRSQIAALQEYLRQLESGKITVSDFNKQLSAIRTSFATSSNAIKQAGENTKTFSSHMGSLAGKFTSWLTVSQVIMQAYIALQRMVTAVIDVDTAMTELRKVTDETEETYNRFLDNAVVRAKELGATVSDTVTATADFARLGYNIGDASQLADAAIIYKNVGDGIEDISEASESIISTMQAFGVAAEDAMFIVDKFNEVGNNFAISSKGVGDALLRSASALAAGNNTLDESIALITTANTIVQNPDVVGTTMKTISMYLRAAKTEAEDAGESTEGMANSVSELRSEILALTGNKVDIQIDENTFKSTYQIIKELSTVWDELTDISQANILEMIGGKRNSNVVAALIENFDLAESVVEDSANAAGSALAENEKYLDSINGKIAEFQATFQELSVTLINSEFVKGVVEFGTGILNVLNAVARVIDAIGGLNTVLGVTAGIIVTINAAGIADMLKKLATPIKSVTALVSTFAESISVAKKNGQSFGAGMSNAFAAATAGASKFQLALGAIGIALTVFSVATTIYKEFHKSTEELVEEAEELKSAFDDLTTEINSNIETLNGLKTEFDELSRGVDTYGNNISLAADDYERYKEIIEQIVGISPELIEGYNAENEYLVNKNGLLERAIELQEREYQNELRSMTTTDKLTTALAGSVATYSDIMSGSALTTDTDLSNSIWRLFNVNDREDIPDDMESGEFLARQIMDALGVANVEEELKKYFNEYGYWQSSWFWDDYVDRIAEDIQSGHSVILDSVDWSDAGFDSRSALDTAIEEAKNAATAYGDVQQQLSDANKDVSDQLMLVAESNSKYADLSNGAKEIVSAFVSQFDVDSITKDGYFGGKVIDENALTNAKVQINEFVEKLTPEIQSAVDRLSALQRGQDIDGNMLSVEEFEREYNDIIDEISGFDSDVQLEIKTAFKIDTDDSIESEINDAIEHTKNLLQGTEAEINEFIDGLSVEDVLKIYYNISAAPNSMTFDELEQVMREIGVNWDSTVNVWDFSSLSNQLDEVEGKFKNLISAMSSLKNGTKLAAGELASLALEYPELLKVSNLFTDTSIENQYAMLDAVLGSYESEYDALIDTKIAELEATNQLMQDQIDLENQKKNKVVEIADLQANGKLDSESEYQRLLNELHDLEGQNYVTYSDGVLAVNQDMLQKELGQTADKVEETRPLFEAQGEMIAESNYKGVSGGLKAFPLYASRLASWARSSLKGILSNIATNISEALSGGDDFVNVFDVPGIADITNDQSITLETEIESTYTIDGKSVDDWSSDYQDVIDERVETITEQIEANNTIIDNLTKLKGLDLKSLYLDGTSTDTDRDREDGSKEVEEYIADIEDYREAIERLNRVQIERAALEERLSNTDDLHEKVAIEKQMLGVYEREQEALHILNNLRDQTISNGAEALRQLGFQVEYDPDNNRFFVENLEHLNELEATEQGEYESMQEATNALRQNTEDLINSLEDLNEANQEGSESWQELEYAIKEAKTNIIDNLKEIVTQASEAVDEIQNVYDTLKAAADEFAANGGFISVDAFQDIVALGPEYMQYLRDENGLLVINEENINKVIAAKTQQLALDNAMSYVERLRLALQEESIEDLNTLLYATTDATNATWGLVYANLALLDLDDQQYAAALHNINAIRSLADNAVMGIGQVAGSATNELEDMRTGLDDILQYVMDMLEQRINNQIQALEDMKEAYRDIIDLRKEALDAAKEEDDYQESVADKVQQIAELQERINALSLDDSRDAQAQRAQLEEEMYDLQKELADEQSDYAIDAQKESLDDMADAYEEEKDKEIAILENSISSYQKLYDMAIDYIRNNWDTLYDELIAWNTEYGSVLNSEITTAWENCLAAAQRYGSYVSALNNIDADISAAQGESGSNNVIVGGSGKYDGPTNEDMVRAIVGRMKEYGAQWNASNSASTNDRLHKAAAAEAAKLPQYGVQVSFDPNSGIWWITKDELDPSNAGKQLHSVYHQGGVAGDNPTLKQNEVLSVLEKGEIILDEPKERELFRLIDFATKLSDKFSELIDSAGYDGVVGGANDILPSTSDIAPINESTNNSVQFGDVYIYGANEETVAKHQEINRQFTNDVLKQLNIRPR